MAVDFSELLDAFEFVSSVGIGENTAFLCKETGKIYWHSDWADDVEEIPDIEDSEEYIRIPEKKELDLGKPLVLKFARHHLPGDSDKVLEIFSREGAYVVRNCHASTQGVGRIEAGNAHCDDAYNEWHDEYQDFCLNSETRQHLVYLHFSLPPVTGLQTRHIDMRLIVREGR
ncbi:hypothetical protein [Rhizobium leguminosarum]|uniref:hypothetical protein n=1 Tax=Rhizobium leguminosarum TaxID=384 RepID=UPI001FE08D80|nr:hypothetical protein [Rhizobium leguminosarum]